MLDNKKEGIQKWWLKNSVESNKPVSSSILHPCLSVVVNNSEYNTQMSEYIIILASLSFQ